jgi:PAS domain S-box-containing protein
VPRSLTHPAELDVSAEDLLAAVLETAAQPIWVVDPEDVIRFANPPAIAALGYDRADELLGRRGHEAVHYRHPDGTAYPAGECPMLLGLATGETVRSELDWFCRRDGSMFPVSYVSAPVAMPQGRGAVVAFADIDDRRRAQQVLREHDAVLVEQQASLRRVAAIVAEGTASAEVFAVIAREAAQLLRITGVHIWRYERDGTGTVMGAWSEQSDPFQPGTSWPFETPSVAAYVQEMKAGRPVRLDNSTEVAGTLADAVRDSGIRSAIGVPIVVGGEIWGMITAGAVDPHPLPDDIEDRLADFTELVATAIANAESRAGLSRLAEEQAALRRVATVVARDASQGGLRRDRREGRTGSWHGVHPDHALRARPQRRCGGQLGRD